MTIKKTIIILFVIVLYAACSVSNQKLFYVKEIIPTQKKVDKVVQNFYAEPPLLRPKGKRRTLSNVSQYFSLAIPNAIDMSGRAEDLQRSLADMLYTEIFKLQRFSLFDRGEFVDLNPEWITSSLKKSATELERQVDSTTFQYLDRKEKNINKLREVFEGADGVLLVYITSRVGTKKGGTFNVDYRIVSKRDYSGLRGNSIVLFAAQEKLNYKTSSSKEVEFDRAGIKRIANHIKEYFPNPNRVRKGKIISRDGRKIVLNLGKNIVRKSGIGDNLEIDKKKIHLSPGLMGYVIYSDDSVRDSNIGGPDGDTGHYSYVAEFIITEVFENTSNCRLLHPVELSRLDGDAKKNALKNYEWDVKVGDTIIIK
nr:hypothetical protein 11 [Candidatus Aminicenantes bacterium]